MDLHVLQNVPSWAIYLTVLIVLLCIYYREVYIKTFSRRIGQPGPLPYPILGHIPYFVKKGLIACHQEWAKTYGKVIGLSYGSKREMIVSDPDLLREIMTKHGSTVFVDRMEFRTDTVLDHHLLSLKGDRWKHVRSILSPTFSTGKLRLMTQLVQQSTETLVDNMSKLCEKNEAFDAEVLFENYTLDTIAATACGIKVDSQNNPDEPILKAAKTMMNSFSFDDPLVLTMFFWPTLAGVCQMVYKLLGRTGFIESAAFFDRLADQLVEERKREEHSGKHRDFLQLVINADKQTENGKDGQKASSEGLTKAEMNGNIALFFIAGFDTTTQGLQFLAYLLATNPEWQDKVIQEVDEVLQGGKPDYDNVQKLTVLDMCLSEALRLYPPGFVLNRVAKEDVTINGHFFAKGTLVNIPVWQIHHDPEYYPDPEVFNPERFTPEAKQARHQHTYLSFGMGPRNCIGMRLAQMELKIAIAMIVQKYKFLTCEKTQIPLMISKQKPIRPEEGVWLKLSARS